MQASDCSPHKETLNGKLTESTRRWSHGRHGPRHDRRARQARTSGDRIFAACRVARTHRGPGAAAERRRHQPGRRRPRGGGARRGDHHPRHHREPAARSAVRRRTDAGQRAIGWHPQRDRSDAQARRRPTRRAIIVRGRGDPQQLALGGTLVLRPVAQAANRRHRSARARGPRQRRRLGTRPTGAPDR